MDPKTFRRICMAFDALIVTFGLSRVLTDLNLATAFTIYSILTIVTMRKAYLLFRFFGTGLSHDEFRSGRRQLYQSPEA